MSPIIFLVSEKIRYCYKNQCNTKQQSQNVIGVLKENKQMCPGSYAKCYLSPVFFMIIIHARKTYFKSIIFL